jgi:hypothetical protein
MPGDLDATYVTAAANRRLIQRQIPFVLYVSTRNNVSNRIPRNFMKTGHRCHVYSKQNRGELDPFSATGRHP